MHNGRQLHWGHHTASSIESIYRKINKSIKKIKQKQSFKEMCPHYLEDKDS